MDVRSTDTRRRTLRPKRLRYDAQGAALIDRTTREFLPDWTSLNEPRRARKAESKADARRAPPPKPECRLDSMRWKIEPTVRRRSDTWCAAGDAMSKTAPRLTAGRCGRRWKRDSRRRGRRRSGNANGARSSREVQLAPRLRNRTINEGRAPRALPSATSVVCQACQVSATTSCVGLVCLPHQFIAAANTSATLSWPDALGTSQSAAQSSGPSVP